VPHSAEKPFHPFVPRMARRAASVVALGALLIGSGAGSPIPRAEAQGLFWESPPPNVVRKAKRVPSVASGKPSKADKKNTAAAATEKPASGPLVINVSLNRQRLVVYDANGPIADSPVSSGRVGYATPTGVFTILEKRRMHHSNLYAGAPMPNMQRITWSGVALHAGALPGYPASHGCIRLPHGFSKKLFGMTKSGTRVIVTRDPISPVAIEHDRLFAAFPPEDSVVTGSTEARETKVADASHVAGGSASSVSGVIGVSVAAAAEGTVAVETPRLSYRERRLIETEKLNAEIRTAGYAKAEKSVLLAQAQKDAAIVREPFLEARADAERLSGQLTDLEQSLKSAERELADLKKPVEETSKKKRNKVKKAVDGSKRIAKIAALEAKIARLPSEIEAVREASRVAGEAAKAAEGVAMEAEDKRRAAMTAFMEASTALSQALARELAAKKLEAKRDLPVSVFISRAKQRLYIRQGYDDILDVAVTFDRPEEPVGTHVFTALDFTEQKTGMKWSVASVPHDPTRGASKKKDKTKKQAKSAEPVVQVSLKSQTAASALDRITIPEDVREQIADVMKPGSSLVISDLGIGNETGAYTDFIVPIR
jgi:lipoprotein-anchoring transpeptidase ErfK/SrfK